MNINIGYIFGPQQLPKASETRGRWKQILAIPYTIAAAILHVAQRIFSALFSSHPKPMDIATRYRDERKFYLAFSTLNEMPESPEKEQLYADLVYRVLDTEIPDLIFGFFGVLQWSLYVADRDMEKACSAPLDIFMVNLKYDKAAMIYNHIPSLAQKQPERICTLAQYYSLWGDSTKANAVANLLTDTAQRNKILASLSQKTSTSSNSLQQLRKDLQRGVDRNASPSQPLHKTTSGDVLTLERGLSLPIKVQFLYQRCLTHISSQTYHRVFNLGPRWTCPELEISYKNSKNLLKECEQTENIQKVSLYLDHIYETLLNRK